MIVPPLYANAQFDNPQTSFSDDVKKFVANWWKDQTSLVLYGQPGRGKTYFLYCLADWFLRKSQKNCPMLVEARDLDDEILAHFREFGTSRDLIRHKYGEADLLFIDDFGMERATDRTERDYYDLFNRRSQFEQLTVISTNLNPNQVEEFYGQRISSRLKRYVWFHFGGKDRRQNEPARAELAYRGAFSNEI